MIRAAVITLAMAVPASAETFIAVAYDEHALVHGFGQAETAEMARDNALEVCGSRHALNCKIAYTRAGSACVGLAVDFTSGGYGIYRTADEVTVKSEVLSHCASYGNENCQVVEAICANSQLEAN